MTEYQKVLRRYKLAKWGQTTLAITLVLLALFLTLKPKKVETITPIVNNEIDKPTIVKVSWYGENECIGCSKDLIMANGQRLDENKYTGACPKKYKLGTLITIRYNKMSITFECTDRGGFEKYGREFDITKGAFEKLAPLSKGVINAEYVNAIVR